jgi:hypothetical protein
MGKLQNAMPIYCSDGRSKILEKASKPTKYVGQEYCVALGATKYVAA